MESFTNLQKQKNVIKLYIHSSIINVPSACCIHKYLLYQREPSQSNCHVYQPQLTHLQHCFWFSYWVVLMSYSVSSFYCDFYHSFLEHMCNELMCVCVQTNLIVFYWVPEIKDSKKLRDVFSIYLLFNPSICLFVQQSILQGILINDGMMQHQVRTVQILTTNLLDFEIVQILAHRLLFH